MGKLDKNRGGEKQIYPVKFAGMAKLVDALALGASGAIHGGSSPLPSTGLIRQQANYRA